MFLADVSIKDRIEKGSLRVIPFKRRHLRPSSICLTLGSSVAEIKWPNKIDVRDELTYPKAEVIHDISGDGFELRPGNLVLASSFERISLDTSLVGIIFNISGLARLGLEVCSSSLVSPGFGSVKASAITLELINKGRSNIQLISGMRICHLAFALLDTTSSGNYDRDIGLYSGELGPKLSAFFRNWK